MSQKPKALIVDYGELTLARTLLNELDVPFWHLRADAVHGPIPAAERLLVIPATLAVSLKVSRTRPKRDEPPTWMAFVMSESKSKRRLLRQAGFDYTVPDNVHAAALRLLMSQAVFDGENTQRVTRVPYGGAVTYVTKLLRQRAILVDMSPRGCRLFTHKPLKKGSRLTVQIPCSDGSPLNLPGVVVRTAPAPTEGGEPGDTAVGVLFASIDGEKRVQYRELLKERASGPIAFGDSETTAVQPSSPAEAAPPDREPEGAPEGEPGPSLYERRVDAFCAGTSCVLVGRDLSENGMRVEKRDGLELGERLRLALPVDDTDEPLIIEAHVAQEEGDRLVLIFDWMEPRARKRLNQLTARLPKIHRLEEDTGTHTAIPTAAVVPGRRGRR